VVIFAVSGLRSLATDARVMLPLEDDWRFHLGEAPDAVFSSFDDSKWRRVDVPHDYVVEGAFIEKDPEPRAGAPVRQDWFWYHAFLPTQPAVYRKTFTLPTSAAGKRLWLEFDGVFSNSFYWLNGKLVGSEYSGYTRTRFDVTTAAKSGGENTLVVQVDPRYDGWWYEGGGIYRKARLVVVEPIHIEPDGIFVAPRLADPGDGTRADTTAIVQTTIANTSTASTRVTVGSEILDAEGRVVATASSIHELGVGGSQKAAQEIA
jgi:beta-galactosidase